MVDQENAILVINDLSLKYQDNPVFKNINMSFLPKKVYSLVGPSGCGKSSFLMCLNRLIDLEPKARLSGDILYKQKSIFSTNMNPVLLKKQISMIFQKPTPFPFSIQKNFKLVLTTLGIKDKGEQARRIERALQQVGLWQEVRDRLDKPALELSGGQQQRLCMARSLCLDPEILLMDEPCSALDPISTSTIEELIVELKTNYTIILVTHNLAQARRVSDEAICFWPEPTGSVIVEKSSSRCFFNEPKSEITKNYIHSERF